MAETRYYLAIDIGASSGRHVLGHVEDGKIVLEEMHRFENIQQRLHGHDCWDVAMLWRNVLVGLEKCRDAGKIPVSVGFDCEVVLPATHDTGSAFLAVPAQDEDAVNLSSGTWSLLGVENAAPITTEASRLQNFTNEGGYQRRFRYLKNIMGLWMIQSIRRELNGVDYVAGKGAARERAAHEVGFGELAELARQDEERTGGAPAARVNVNDEQFLSPASMMDEIRQACRESGQEVPETTGALMRCVYESLVACYAESIVGLSALTGRAYTSVNVVGGGCQDAYLNDLTARACGMPVFAGPVEGTSLGNLLVQMIAAGEFADLQEARGAIRASFDIRMHLPR